VQVSGDRDGTAAPADTGPQRVPSCARSRTGNSPEVASGIKAEGPGSRPNIGAPAFPRDSASNGGRHGPLHERTAGRRRLLLQREQLEVEVIPNEGGHLKGGNYAKVPFPVLFVVVPTLGAAFLMFMRVIGFALFGYAITRKLAAAFTSGATDLAATVQPGQFATGAAYFTGKPEEKKEGAEAPTSAELEKIEQEIAARKESK
jgi:hypothetical protein